MLLELKVSNLAIIESIEIHWSRGLNILTGETGAGKSILLEALNLILGGRSDRSLVRTGQREAWVEGLFEMDETLQVQLKEWGIEADLDEPLALRRVVQSNGRSRAYVNCISVPASHIRQLSSQLIDFGRQHDQAMLLNPENHLGLLDTFAEATKEREVVESAYAELTALLKEKKQLYETRHYRADRMEFLLYQREAIRLVNPQPGEEKALNEELRALSQREKQKDLATSAEQQLYTDDDSVQEHLASVMGTVEQLAGLDDVLEGVYDDLQSALMSIEEAGRSLRAYQQKLNLDEHYMEGLRERIDQIIRLQEKYGGDFESVMERLDEIEDELEDLEHKQHQESTLGALIKEARLTLLEASGPLSEKRRMFAASLTQRVQHELADLAMRGTRFVVQFRPLSGNEGVACEELILDEETGEPTNAASVPRVASWGAERGSFYLAANQGEELRPLERVASGGELSRILLALKRVLAGATTVQTFVFDEIDSGVAGAAATQVAKKLRQIASTGGDGAQILCISHTPQIAAEADAHLHVSKKTIDGRTRSGVQLLNHEERVTEIARMLAGDQSMGQAVDLARQLLNSATNAPIPEAAVPVEDLSRLIS